MSVWSCLLCISQVYHLCACVHVYVKVYQVSVFSFSQIFSIWPPRQPLWIGWTRISFHRIINSRPQDWLDKNQLPHEPNHYEVVSGSRQTRCHACWRHATLQRRWCCSHTRMNSIPIVMISLSSQTLWHAWWRHATLQRRRCRLDDCVWLLRRVGCHW